MFNLIDAAWQIRADKQEEQRKAEKQRQNELEQLNTMNADLRRIEDEERKRIRQIERDTYEKVIKTKKIGKRLFNYLVDLLENNAEARASLNKYIIEEGSLTLLMGRNPWPAGNLFVGALKQYFDTSSLTDVFKDDVWWGPDGTQKRYSPEEFGRNLEDAKVKPHVLNHPELAGYMVMCYTCTNDYLWNIHKPWFEIYLKRCK